MNDFIHICQSRGLIHQITELESLNKILKNKNNVRAYIGFDATANSFHIGNMIQMILLKWWQKCGHTPIALIGGGTTLIGDPSGKDSQRKILTRQEIIANSNAIQRNIEHFFPPNSDVIFANNYNWLHDLKYIDLLRLIGPHFSISRMLSFDSVKTRLEREQNLSFLEFNYMILQAYDFLTLARNHECLVQFGGSDQWGNIVCGIDLNRRIDGRHVFGVTSPLLTTASGTKMGKTEKGAVWLDKKLFSVFDFWQYWRNCEDQDVCKFLKMLTDIPLKEIAKHEKLSGEELNESKILLANAVTSLVHSKDDAVKAMNTASQLYSNKGTNNTINLPVINLSIRNNCTETLITELLHDTNLCQSRSASRRLMDGGGLKIDNQTVKDIKATISVFSGKEVMVSIGKKRHVKIIWS